MKFTAAIAALILAAAVSATAVPNPNAEPRCGYRGQACGKAKREALALAEADARCGYRGQACGKVKRAADAFAEALAEADDTPDHPTLKARCDMGACYEAKMMTRDLAAIVAETTTDPAAWYDSLNLEDEEVSEKLKRDASARCGYRGQACGRDISKRDAEAEADPEAKARCGYRGQACGKLRRAAEAVAEAVADPEPMAKCGYRGQACGKAKRDALALAHAADLVLGNL